VKEVDEAEAGDEAEDRLPLQLWRMKQPTRPRYLHKAGEAEQHHALATGFLHGRLAGDSSAGN
jgi:hypothetical protein